MKAHFVSVRHNHTRVEMRIIKYYAQQDVFNRESDMIEAMDGTGSTWVCLWCKPFGWVVSSKITH